jgi:hypothetical protein
MAATVASYTGDRLVTTTYSPSQPETWPTRKTGSDDEREWLCASIGALAGLWSDFKNGKNRTFDTRSRVVQGYRAGLGSPSMKHARQDVNQPTRAVQLLDLFPRPPPSYEESLADVPPDYTGTDAAAVVNSLVDAKLGLDFPDAAATCRDSQRRSDAKLDFNQPHGIRYHAKKAKKAAKTAQKAAWADDDGDKKEEPPADDGAGGDAGGGDAGGGDAGGDAGGGGDGGGDPPGGDGGDDPEDIWGAAGGGKKKKKKKKNAW